MPETKTKDEKKFLTALVVSLMLKTGERVGNETSMSNGHIGISGLQKKHITITENCIELNYTGKSGVKHEKQFTDETLAKHLKQAIQNSPKKYVFCTSDGFKIKNAQVNRYLSEHGNISSKDIRGFSANSWTVKKLNEIELIPDTEAARTKELNKILKKVAAQIGHGAATLKKHYLIPELSEQFIMEGKVIELKTFMEEGGEVGEIKYFGLYDKEGEYLGVVKSEQTQSELVNYIDGFHDKGYVIKKISQKEYEDYSEGDELTPEDLRNGNFTKMDKGGDVKTKMKTLLNLLHENPDTLTSQEISFLHELSETFGKKIALNNPKLNKIANSFGIFDKKVIKELAELSVVIEARKIANS